MQAFGKIVPGRTKAQKPVEKSTQTRPLENWTFCEGPSARNGPKSAVLDPETAKNGPKPPSRRHQNPFSERQTQNHTKSWKLGVRDIQWNRKGRRTVSPILQNSVRNHSGNLGPLKSAEKQAKKGSKTAFLARFRGFGPLGRAPGSKNAKNRKNRK